MKKAFIIFFGLFVLAQTVVIAQTKQDSAWLKWNFLLGEWEGEGGGDPGKGKGGFSFTLDLDKRILVRKNHAEYPATKNKAAFAHDDIMIVYADIPGKPASAIYFDNEDHVIKYKVSFSEDNRSVIFLSEEVPGTPRFRLTYTQKEAGKVDITFEFAPPGKPDAFSPYIRASAVKKRQ